jgi:hypothetical protein
VFSRGVLGFLFGAGKIKEVWFLPSLVFRPQRARRRKVDCPSSVARAQSLLKMLEADPIFFARGPPPTGLDQSPITNTITISG